MAAQLFDTAVVKNITGHTVPLRSGDGDSVDILAYAQVPIMRKFLLWQPPARSKIRIISEQIIEPAAPNETAITDLAADQQAQPADDDDDAATDTETGVATVVPTT